jgi:hypothetical protein
MFWNTVSAIKHHTPGNNPQDYMQHLEHGESLKSRRFNVINIQLKLQDTCQASICALCEVNEPFKA